MMSDQPRISFEEDIDPDEIETNQGLKLSKKKSFLSNKKPSAQEALNNRAQDINSKRQQRLTRAWELGNEFKELLADKTVSSQMSEMKKSREREVINKLIEFAIEVNTDEDEHEGMGSVTLLTLALKILLQIRDKYNELDYKYHQLEKYASKLEVKLNSVSSHDSKE